MILDRIMLRKAGRHHHDRLSERVQQALSNQDQRKAILKATRHVRQKSLDAYSKFARSQEVLDDVRRIKHESISNLTENVQAFISNAESNGTKVFLAKTKKNAADYIMKVLTQNHAHLIVKSKSMTTEELGLNEHLLRAGFDVVETDLGERIVQLATQKPSHIVAPAIHLSRYQVADIFSKSMGLEVPPVPEEITKLARKSLRGDFLNADVGISGANVAVAEDGSVLIVTNEGNERLVTGLPPVYIAVVGIEKAVPTLSEALKVTRALCMSSTGQRISRYVSIIRGPNSRTAIGQLSARREMHVVLVDDERTKIAEDEVFQQALYCLKCGSCLNVCPTYREVGGHVFGKSYTGPIGIPWTSFSEGSESAAQFAPLCISCGLCKLACPVDINIPLLIAHVKETNVQSDGQLPVNWFLSHYESFEKFMSKTAPISNRLLSNPVFRLLLEKTVGIDRRRIFPRFENRTFEDWFNRQKHSEGRDVVYFVDTYANLNNPDIGKATVNLLSKAGYRVLLPPQRGSGMPAFLCGELEFLRKIAEFNVGSFIPFAQQGTPIVASEPTAAYCLREIYPELLRTESARIVARNSYEVLGFLRDHRDSFHVERGIPNVTCGRAAYHTPCHTWCLYKDSSPPGPDLLRRVGVEVEQVDFQGCCGIGGTYGFKKGLDGFDVSMAVGEELLSKISEMKPDYVVTESSVCKIQIEQGLRVVVKHPLEILSESYGLM